MAAFERFDGMGDVRLTPRMLRNLLTEHVPDEKQPLSNPLSLSKVVSTIQTHKLLSELLPESTELKLVERWKSAVDDWVDRLLALISSDMPDKCWAGLCLMGVTCQECSSNRFFTSYSVWFNKILPHIQHPGGSRIIRVASCSSISDLLTRLARFPHAKKDAVSHAGKLIQPIMKLLDEDTSEALWEGALHLLCTIIIFFPAAIHSNYDKVEAAIASKIFSAKSSDNMLKKLAHFLALLPKAKGDEGSWSLMMQKLLISINAHLNNFFQGLEEETKGKQAITLLVPPGKDSPPPLGGQTGVLDDVTWKSEQLIVSRVSALIFCCCTMLTSSYKVKVNVPIRSLLSLIERVLAVNGSLPHAMLPFMTAMQQEFVCTELPVLHSSALELLLAILKSIRSQLLPYAATTVRLVTTYLRKCSLPELRIKLYSITKMLLISMGVGMAMHLAQEVVTNAFADLKPIATEGFGSSSSKNPTNKALLQPCVRKRKHSATAGIDMQPENAALEVGASESHPITPIPLKIAALEALEALLTIGGAQRSEGWRASVDKLLITTASNACSMRWADAEANHFLHNESATALAEYQLAAFRTLLASLLSPSHVRPAFLAEGLELFRTGKLETGTKVAEFCAHALLSLEVLIHPRALPLDDLPPLSNQFPENVYPGGQKHNPPTLSKMNGIGNNMTISRFLDDDDDLCNRWLSESSDVPSNLKNQRTADTTAIIPETKKRKHGNDVTVVVSETIRDNVATDASENIQDDIAMVVSETVQDNVAQVVSENVLESAERAQEHTSNDAATVPEEVAMQTKDAGTQEVNRTYHKEASVKKSLMDILAVSNGEKREAADHSDDDSLGSVPSLKDEDFRSSSESESESDGESG